MCRPRWVRGGSDKVAACARSRSPSPVAGTSRSPSERFSATPPIDPAPAQANGEDTRTVLSELGYSADRVEELLSRGAVAEAVRA